MEWTILFIVLWTVCASGEKAGLLVDVECGTDVSSTAVVHIVSELRVRATLVCKDDHTYALKEEFDQVRHTGQIYYQGHNTDEACVFNNYFPESDVYEVEVKVAYYDASQKSTGLAFESTSKTYKLTCSFTAEGDDFSPAQTIDTSKMVKKTLTVNKGGAIQSEIQLETLDLSGNVIAPTESVPLGKIIKLRGKLKDVPPGSSETGLKPLTCKASDGNNEYAILVSGCGDGNVIHQTQGFTTTGTETTSPPFRAFRLQGSLDLHFHCTFTSCRGAGGCDGNSCKNT